MNITISTGTVNQEFEILDTIFAVDSHKEGFWSGNADPNKAFEGVKASMKEKCKQLGGNAVINCQFEYRNAIADGVFSKKQVIEIFAYGTAVNLK